MYKLLEFKVGQRWHRSYFKTKEGNISGTMTSISTKGILPLLIKTRLLYNRYLSNASCIAVQISIIYMAYNKSNFSYLYKFPAVK